MLIGRNRENFFLIVLLPRANYSLLIGRENTCSWLAEHAMSIFTWFLHFVLQLQRVLSSSLEFVFFSRIVWAKNIWKSSATATKEIPKGELSFLTSNSKTLQLFVSKAKILDRILRCEKGELFALRTGECFYSEPGADCFTKCLDSLHFHFFFFLQIASSLRDPGTLKIRVKINP